MTINAYNALSILMDRGDISSVPMTPDTLVMLPPRDGIASFGDAWIWSPWADAHKPITGADAHHVSVPIHGPYTHVVVFPEKDRVAMTGQIALALRAVDLVAGIVITAADADAGGKRMADMFETFGLTVTDQSKSHARVVVCSMGGQTPDRTKIDTAADSVSVPVRGSHGFYTLPGLHGSDKLDAGSVLLVNHLPRDLSGVGADFGCGYGYLTAEVLKIAPHVTSFYAIDADARAIECARLNVPNASIIWANLAAGSGEIPEPLDFIVMNPPFHIGAAASSTLGKNMIATAHAALKPGGQLYMVANRHLPYEKLLGELFSDIQILTQDQGFKIFVATR